MNSANFMAHLSCSVNLARQTQEETVSLPCTFINTLLYLMTRTGTSVLADLQSVNRMKSLGVRDQRNRPKTLYPSSSTKDGFDRETRHRYDESMRFGHHQLHLGLGIM